MVLALTTVARVRELARIVDTTAGIDTILTDLISEVSQQAEDFLGRHLSVERRTEVLSVKPNHQHVSLRGMPITSVSSVKYSASLNFTDVEVLDAACYDVRNKLGQIYLRFGAIGTQFNPAWLEVQYSGGMATSTDDFRTNYPRLEMAVRREVVNRFNRREHPEGEIKAFEAGVTHAKELGPLEDFYAALAPRRRLSL